MSTPKTVMIRCLLIPLLLSWKYVVWTQSIPALPEGKNVYLSQLAQQARSLADINPDSVYLLTAKIFAAADSSEIPYIWADALLAEGLAKNAEGKWIEAEKKFRSAIPIYRQQKDSLAIADAMDYLGFSLLEQGYLDQHLELQIRVLDYRIRFKAHKNRIARSYSIIGSVYYRLGKLDLAMQNYEKTLQIRQNIPNLEAKYIGFTLRNIGNVYFKKMIYDKAENHYLDAIDSFKISRANQFTIQAHQLLGRLYLEQDKMQRADKNFQLALSTAIRMNSIAQRGTVYLDKAKLHQKQRQFNLALAALDSAKIYLVQANANDHLKDMYLLFSEIYEAQNNPLNALDNYKAYITLKDTLLTKETATKMAELQTKYEIAQKERQILQLEQEQEREQQIKFLLGLALFMAIISIFAIVNANAKRRSTFKALKIEKEKADQLNKVLSTTQNQLVQSEKMASLGQLTAGIAHEINNPINYISSNAEAIMLDFNELKPLLQLLLQLEKEPNNPKLVEQISTTAQQLEVNFLLEEMEHLIKSISRGGERVSEIVKGLKIFTHPSEGHFKPEDVSILLNSAVTILKNKMKTKDIQLKLSIEELPKVSCQAGRINQVFVNIIDNAIDALPLQGILEISASNNSTNTDDSFILIKIKDNGKGMDEVTIQRIFDPFYTTKEVGKGTGLGMAISYKIIQEHRGKIDIDSQPGQGTTISIALPVNLK